MLRQYKNKAIGGISDFVSSIGKPSIPSSGKPHMPSSEKPKLSGWDRFKNGLASIWNATGAKLTGKEAHVIKPEDYVKNEKGEN